MPIGIPIGAGDVGAGVIGAGVIAAGIPGAPPGGGLPGHGKFCAAASSPDATTHAATSRR
jgi:hypothetical protein